LDQATNKQVASTVPQNGDTNPYGVAVVPFSSGNLVAGDVLVTNFNNAAGTAGAGTTIVQVNPSTGASTLFYQGTSDVVGPDGIVFNPAKDIVWVGDYGPPNVGGVYDGALANVTVISPSGQQLALFNNNTTGQTIFNGVWGQSVSDVNGQIAFYWPNAGDGTTGTGGGGVWRLNPLSNVAGQPLESSYKLIGAGLAYVNTPGTTASTVGGPQGMVYDPANGTLYVADDVSNEIVAIPDAASATATTTPTVIATGGMLSTPQGIALNPTNGDLLVVNGAGNNDLLEYTPTGTLVASLDLQPTMAPGALFGLAATTNASGQLVVYYGIDDTNTLWSLTAPPLPCPTGVSHQAPGTPVAIAADYQTINGQSCPGYLIATSSGGVTAVGSAVWYGDMSGSALANPVVGIAANPNGQGGYWLVAADGGVFTFGPSTNFYGSAVPYRPAAPIVGMTADPATGGYWLAGSDGGVFTFGPGTPFYGSAVPYRPAAPIVGMTADPATGGYWLAGSDGGVFTFGPGTPFYGSAVPYHPVKPVEGLVAAPGGNGYWLYAADGGVFTFGDIGFYGAAASDHPGDTVPGMAATSNGDGYWQLGADGTIYPFGNATNLGG
jgi:sugar lactone lactonase YvrE